MTRGKNAEWTEVATYTIEAFKTSKHRQLIVERFRLKATKKLKKCDGKVLQISTKFSIPNIQVFLSLTGVSSARDARDTLVLSN